MTGKGRRPGRPRGGRNVKTILREIARESICVRDGAPPISIAEALLRKLQHLAMQGDIEADKALDRHLNHLDPEPQAQGGGLLAPGMLNPEEWIRREMIANEFREQPTM